MPDSRESSGALRIPYGTYCLHCYAPLARSHEASVHCPRCDGINLRVDRETRWTLEPGFVRLENALVAVVWGSAVLAFAWSFGARLGFGLGHVIAIPVIAGFFHATAMKVTHRFAGVRFDILWTICAPAVLFVAAVLPLILGLRGGGPEPRTEPLTDWERSVQEALPYVFLGVLLLSPVVAFFAARALERGKARRVLTRMRAAS